MVWTFDSLSTFVQASSKFCKSDSASCNSEKTKVNTNMVKVILHSEFVQKMGLQYRLLNYGFRNKQRQQIQILSKQRLGEGKIRDNTKSMELYVMAVIRKRWGT